METRIRELGSSIDPSEAAHALRLLVAIADLRSFSAAAERLGLTPSAVSKAVSRAEARLGVRLVQRTTRRVSLTDLGEAYVARGRQLLADVESLERDIAARDQAVRGPLRVAAPAVYGACRVAPICARFQAEHPGVTVDLRCGDRLADLVEERIDVAVRMVTAPPAELVARPLEDDRRGLYASPGYLRRRRAPRDAAELGAHAGLRYGPGGASHVVFRLVEPGGAEAPVRVPAAFSSDSVLAVLEATRAGLGLAELPAYLVADDVAAGRLREVLAGWLPVRRRVVAVYLPSRFLPARVRAFVDHLAGALRAPDRPRR
ncbi:MULTISPECIES: LysR family transcriptional regulator [Sorangium]|uniref:LysR family transcriptional regulator n=1 Tax=Sorangium cellulosum TaxID=56 RepID=A0A4P2R128_SORCE|nr:MULTISPECIES: LysR family transcriptional regulator [Sorangium]AUX36620.1 LysR family transcriptional regulator [Sorangium cellulosum]WCQ95918.1 HTH-type transcriptional regulator DmlR [Sorangium sp. Soce836]